MKKTCIVCGEEFEDRPVYHTCLKCREEFDKKMEKIVAEARDVSDD